MRDPRPCGTARRSHPRRPRESGFRAARVAALRAARLRGELVIDPDRIARHMIG